jgi:hypothetical protein
MASTRRLTFGLSEIVFSAEVSSALRAECVLIARDYFQMSQLSQQVSYNGEPFGTQWLPANGLTRTTVPISCVALVAFLPMQVGVNPRTILAFVLLSGVVCSRPIALGIPPQSGEGVSESGWRLGRRE